MKIPASASWCLTGQEVDHPRETTIDRLFQELLENDVDQLNRVALVNAETDTEVTYGELNERATSLISSGITDLMAQMGLLRLARAAW